MNRKFKTANYEETLNLSVTLREALPPNHLARFVVDMISQLDLSAASRAMPRLGEKHSRQRFCLACCSTATPPG